MKLFNKILILVILGVSSNVFGFLGDVVAGAGEAAGSVVAGAGRAAADVVDATAGAVLPPYDRVYDEPVIYADEDVIEPGVVRTRVVPPVEADFVEETVVY